MSTQKNKNTGNGKNRTIWIIGCSSLIIIGLCLVFFALLGGFASIRNILGSRISKIPIPENKTTKTIIKIRPNVLVAIYSSSFLMLIAPLICSSFMIIYCQVYKIP